MAKSQYSADSASPPQSLSPPNGNKVGAFKIVHFPAPFLKVPLSVPTTFVLTGINGYIGENTDLGRRHQEHGSVGRHACKSDTPTPISID
jgi:hypothetical protein